METHMLHGAERKKYFFLCFNEFLSVFTQACGPVVNGISVLLLCSKSNTFRITFVINTDYKLSSDVFSAPLH